MRKYICVVVSAIGGVLCMYGAPRGHEKGWYILGLAMIFLALREVRKE